MKLELKINQRIYSKKNSRQVIVRGNKRFLVPSAAYNRTKNGIVQELLDQLDGRKPAKPIFNRAISVHTEFYIPGKSRADGDNLHTSVLDILQDANIIADDMFVIEGSYEKHPGSGGWGCEITIKTL